uniref:Glycerol-3-phosphate acyltransferase 2, mitochondrial n=1 Tax=Echeneis naucrates TaxID=173247 RepID=A0A665T5A8_ECHNA
TLQTQSNSAKQQTVTQQLSWELKIKRKLTTVPPCLGKFRPVVGQCCHQCTPDSLVSKKLGRNSSLGFHNLLNVNETQTRYRGWLVRRVCCVLFASGCKVYASHVGNRLERVCQSNRYPVSNRPHCAFLPCHLPLILSVTCCSTVPEFVCWMMLKMFATMFCNIQVNLNHLLDLHRGSQLVYVYVRQSSMECALIPLLLFCHNLRVPYTLCPLQVNSSFLRSILQKVGVVLLPPSASTTQEAEMDHLYSPVMTSLIRELLHEGQAMSVGVSAQSGQGGEWLACIRQLIKEGSVPDVSLVPVGISYDSLLNVCACVHVFYVSLRPGGSVRIHLAQPFSLKEMCESGRCRVDVWLPLQDLLLPVILNKRTESVFGQRRMSWLLPSHYASEQEAPTHPERDLSIAIILHLIFSATSCMAVMSTSLVSSLLLYKQRKGMSASALCRDVAWLTEELLFRNKDMGFGGGLVELVHYSLNLLAPHLIIAAVPSRKDPFIVVRPSLAATLHLALQARSVTHAFISEAVGACAVSSMLCEVAISGVKSDLEFDVVLCQSELTERALQLCHLLPPGYMPPCQSSYSFALDAVDSLVRCGILIMEEIPRDVPICDFWKRECTLSWTTTDDPYHSDSDCEEQELRSYKISQPSHCPEMLFFLCSVLAGHLRALCWTVSGLELIDTCLTGECTGCLQGNSCSEEAAHTAVRTLIDLRVSDSFYVCVSLNLFVYRELNLNSVLKVAVQSNSKMFSFNIYPSEPEHSPNPQIIKDHSATHNF